jgi:hypothetical protein
MSRITAAEARKLVGPTVQERVDEVYPLIRKAAEAGQREIRLHGEFWENEGYSKTDDYKQACSLLEADGFGVRFYYEERQFVDMGTIVEW